jgi:hypothetical protein
VVRSRVEVDAGIDDVTIWACGARRNGASLVIDGSAAGMQPAVGSAPPGPNAPGPAKSVVTSLPWPFFVLKMWKLLNVWSTTNAVVPSAENSMSVAIAASSMSILPTRFPVAASSFTMPNRMMSWNDAWYLSRFAPSSGNGLNVTSGKSRVAAFGVQTLVFLPFFLTIRQSANASGSRLKRPLETLFSCSPPTQS